MTQRNVTIARCPEHGLHGQRTECFVCGGPVEQVSMVPVDALLTDEAIEAGAAAVRGLLGGEWIKYQGGEGLASLAIKAAIAAASPEREDE